jgi:ribosomal protein S18 acetylase RimI-like enzyme
MPFQVRPASVADVETLVAFNAAMAMETEAKQLDRRLVELGVQGLIGNASRGRYLLACNDEGRVIGQLMHTYEWSDWRNGDVWWIQSVYVEPAFRRLGVFQTLYRTIRSMALEAGGVVGLRLYVEHENRNAQATYRAMGMRDAGYSVMEEMFSGATSGT